MKIEGLNTWEAARKVVNVHGDSAVRYASQQADACQRAGDTAGMAQWALITTAVADLLDRSDSHPDSTS